MLEPLSFVSYSCKTQGLPGGTLVKNSPAGEGDEALIDPRAGKIPWRRKWPPTPVFLPREFRRQWSLAGYSPGAAEDPGRN